MYAYHHSHLSQYREPFGAVPAGGKVRLALDVHQPESGLNCFVRIWHDTEGLRMVPMRCTKWGDPAVYEAEFSVPGHPGLMWYSFVLEKLPTRIFYGNNDENMGGEGRNVSSAPKGYQITVYEPETVPAWYSEGIAYQIFPDRFKRGSDWLKCQEDAIRPGDRKGPRRILRLDWSDNPIYERNADSSIARWDFFGGTLSGIREKLLYLKSLGVTCIYLNPVFEASSNHKYDTADYMRVDPGFGGDEGLRALVEEAKSVDIHIILDGVFSHTGADSKYFDVYGNYGGTGAASSKESPCYPWYSFKSWPSDYECWWGVKDLPNVDELNPTYLEFITGDSGVIRHWMEMGIAGWRLDVADELPDEFIARLRATVSAADPESLLLGEVWEDASNKISYGVRRRYILGRELMSVMNYPFREAMLDFFTGRIDAMRVTALLLRQMENYPHEIFYAGLNLISSHDRERALTVLGEAPAAETWTETERAAYRLPAEQRALGIRRLKALSFVQFTMPGVPCIYYGDEAGLEGYKDPYNRRTYPWGHEDGDLLHHYRVVTTLRKQHEALTKGSIWMLNADTAAIRLPADVLGFVRKYGDERLTVLVNRSKDSEARVTVEASAWMLELLSARWYAGVDGRLEVVLPPLGYVVYQDFSERPVGFRREREVGVIAHISAMPGGGAADGGAGDGIDAGAGAQLSDAYRFVDFLRDAGIGLWQVLPVTPVGYGGSPYQSPGAFAGKTGFVTLTEEEAGVGSAAGECGGTGSAAGEAGAEGPSGPGGAEDEAGAEGSCGSCGAEDEAGAEGSSCEGGAEDEAGAEGCDEAFLAFCAEAAYWLDDYCLFKAIKEVCPDAWQDWPEAERDRGDVDALLTRYAAGVEREKRAQFRFWSEWDKLMDYAHAAGIKVIGDMPLGVSEDSADVWAHRELFQLDADGRAALTAGVPPDYFNGDGQNWGTPVYNWERLRESGYEWWIRRMEHAFRTFDFVRLDHFRGFSEYYSIPRGMSAAAGGWRTGPGIEFFRALEAALGGCYGDAGGALPIIAEDLGNLDPGVYDLLAISGYPGMDVYQFEEAKMLHASAEDAGSRIYYSSTHDSSTLLGWCEEVAAGAAGVEPVGEGGAGGAGAVREDDAAGEDGAGAVGECGDVRAASEAARAKAADIMKWLLSSDAPWVIFSIQDILGLGDEARFNTPGTVSSDNWSWRIPAGALTPELAARLRAALMSTSRCRH